MDWITNSPEAARQLRAADDAYAAARRAASGLPLAAKVEALRQAKQTRQAAYDQLLHSTD